jgi:hypothetical protein
LAYLEEEVAKVESENVKAIVDCVRLDEVLDSSTPAPGSLEVAKQCEEQLRRVTDAPTLLMLNERLFKVWALLGRPENARRAFARFHQTLKHIVANLPDRSTANRFLARQDVADTLSAYRVWEKRQANARS